MRDMGTAKRGESGQWVPMGPPPRVQTLSVKVSEIESGMIKAAAEAAGLPLSAFLRVNILGVVAQA